LSQTGSRFRAPEIFGALAFAWLVFLVLYLAGRPLGTDDFWWHLKLGEIYLRLGGEVFRKSLNLAIRWGWISQNPATGVKRNQEEHRTRYLSHEEIVRLVEAMDGHPDQKAVNAVRLLLLTGARKGEVLSASWSQFDLENGTWTRPSSHTKQKREHRVPLSAPAVQLLTDMKREATGALLFPGKNGRPMSDIKKTWDSACKDAGLVKLVDESRRKKDQRDDPVYKPTVWLHDLRRTYASLLASSGHSLPVIGALLGHTQAQTTQRYAHLFEDPLRQATESVGALVGDNGSDVRRQKS
jgi:integrase